ncbi:MAG: helix-turn-helix transcriptional regulator [Treponema sp.]|jgi:transcriptional regulator with XRE-family HTH domain|nr:helix-turn-helix transcriptional regulator [Treponema sp.]
MTNIREVLAGNLRKFRQDRGWSQTVLAEKTGTSPHYIGMLENQNKFPSSEMVQKLASALKIDPTELFSKKIDPQSSIKNSQKAALETVGMAVNRILTKFITDEIQKLDDAEEEKGVIV